MGATYPSMSGRGQRRARKYAWIAGCISLCCSSVAGAATYKTTFSRSGILEITKPFQAFGNFTTGDCQYETAANLVLARWPKSKITTSEVLSAYSTYGIGFDPNYAVNGLVAGQNYLLSHGFAGHRAASITTVTNKYQIVQAANNGGVEASITGPVMMHVLGIIQANSKTLTVVDDGFITHYTWTQFVFDYTHVVTSQGTYAFNNEQIAYQAVKW